MPLFVVDTISMHRVRYVIEADEASHAADEVTMIDSGEDGNYFPEFSQRYLGETISDVRHISKTEYRKMLEESKTTGEGSHWLGDKLIRKIKYEGKEASDS